MDEISIICIKSQRSMHMYSFKVLADIRQKYIFFKMAHLTVKKLIVLFARCCVTTALLYSLFICMFSPDRV